jgi:hypothetical protein
MRRIVMALVPLTILAACSSEPAEEPVTEEVAEEIAEAPAMTAANGSPAGTYEVTAADGTVTTSTLNADGTYEDTAADGKTCFTPTTEGEEAMCYTETAPAADGSFTATPDSGDPLTVRPAVAAAVAEEAPVQ